MIDFLMISTRSTKRGVMEIYPKFIIKKSSDLMIRGSDFYAIWIEERGLWSTDEQDALRLIDDQLDKYAEENRQKFDSNIKILHMWDAESGMIDCWHRYCQKQMRDSFTMLDEKLVFANSETNKNDFASKRLSYAIGAGDISSYDKLISTLYDEEERQKIEWMIGSIMSGESKKLQKFMVLYGSAGTGKSTILNIIQQLFEGYYSVFDAQALGSSSNSFALEAFKNNPLVAIQHDGDLSRIEDNTRLNSLVSHELMTVNEKFKSTYANRFKCILFMGTNKPVKITDAKSGIIRRLIDVSPSGNKLGAKEYKTIVKNIDFELGAIAHHCEQIFLNNPSLYDDYVPTAMMGASNEFYNFVSDSYFIFKDEDATTLTSAWELYKVYCDDSKVPYPASKRVFKEELKNYFDDYKDRFTLNDGTRIRSYYIGFKTDKFEEHKTTTKFDDDSIESISFNSSKSIFDSECSNCLSQYANTNEIPTMKWDNVKTTLSDIDTSKIHYVKIPENHIVIDFDIPDENGNKSFEKNIIEASKWPPTYAELSKSGNGIHLHYIYTGDVSKLSRVYSDHIEVKIFNGKSSLRRKLTKCNDIPISTISSGLPMKGDNEMINFKAINTEKGIRTLIKKNLNKEIHPGTKPSLDFIYKILDDAYNDGLKYDVTDMRNAILAFAVNSSHQSEYCVKLIKDMKFKSEDISDNVKNDESNIVFFDCEVFPNLFIVNWKSQGDDKPIVRMINPKPTDIEELVKYRLVGFNCRRYDNHILYARLMGYSNEKLYSLSQKIITGSPNCFFGEAYNLSYTDIYDFASAGNKKSLKKFEIELGLHHQELGLPWNEPVAEELWVKVAEYCDNDVIATEATFNHLSGDWTARQILADLADMSVNDTTNTLTTKIIFGSNRKPQDEFNYRNLSQAVCYPSEITDVDEDVFKNTELIPFNPMNLNMYNFIKKHNILPLKFTAWNGEKSVLPFFPGYNCEFNKSIYRDEEVGEGGYVYSEPGMYSNVALLDVASMHPNSLIAEVLLGSIFTERFKEIVDGRIHIKHEAWDEINNILDGKLTQHIQKVKNGEMTSKQLADALKTAINSVYGLTSAKFDNPFKDKRNIDNLVAKRGALFMIDLKHEVKNKGFTVAHIKTDSIKIPNATPEIIQFVMDFGKKYGYTFEHEATYNRMCLVNDAVYIAQYDDGKWTATGTQFQVPYVFKTLFSKENIEFEDICETKSVTSALYLDMNEGLNDVTMFEKVKLIRNDILANRNITNKDMNMYNTYSHLSDDELEYRIAEGHDYKFIGKVGCFCPIKDGFGGGVLLREKDGKYYAATGSKGYRWQEAEMIKQLGKEDTVDISYYNKMVDEAVKTISGYGDFEWFTNGIEQ